MKYLYLLLLFITVSAQAQKNLSGFRIFLNPSTFTEKDAGAAMGVEYRFSNRISIAAEGTWIYYNYDDLGKSSKPPFHGFRITPDIKFFIPGKHNRNIWFFAVQTSYKQVNFFQNYIVPKYEDGEEVYEQLIAFEKKKQMVGVGTRMGVQKTFGGKKERFFFEGSLGLGIKYKWSTWIQAPPPNSYREGHHPINTENGWFPDVPFKIRLGYRF